MIDRLLQPKRPHTFYALSLVDFALKINDNSFLRLFLSHICLLVMLSNENLNWPDDARYPYTWYVEKYDAIQASLIAAIMNTQKKDVHYYQLLAACQVICAILRTPLETEIQFTQANGKITLLTTKFKELYKMLMQQKKDVTLAQTHLDELKLFCQNIKSKANEYNQQLIQQVNDIVESLN